MTFNVGDSVTSQYGEAVVIRVEQKPRDGVAGRYTIRALDGTVCKNYPGYLLAKARS